MEISSLVIRKTEYGAAVYPVSKKMSVEELIDFMKKDINPLGPSVAKFNSPRGWYDNVLKVPSYLELDTEFSLTKIPEIDMIPSNSDKTSPYIAVIRTGESEVFNNSFMNGRNMSNYSKTISDTQYPKNVYEEDFFLEDYIVAEDSRVYSKNTTYFLIIGTTKILRTGDTFFLLSKNTELSKEDFLKILPGIIEEENKQLGLGEDSVSLYSEDTSGIGKVSIDYDSILPGKIIHLPSVTMDLDFINSLLDKYNIESRSLRKHEKLEQLINFWKDHPETTNILPKMWVFGEEECLEGTEVAINAAKLNMSIPQANLYLKEIYLMALLKTVFQPEHALSNSMGSRNIPLVYERVSVDGLYKGIELIEIPEWDEPADMSINITYYK